MKSIVLATFLFLCTLLSAQTEWDEVHKKCLSNSELSNVEEANCLYEAYLVLDSSLIALYDDHILNISAALVSGKDEVLQLYDDAVKKQLESLVTMKSAFILYRDALADLEAANSAGGSGAGMELIKSKYELTEKEYFRISQMDFLVNIELIEIDEASYPGGHQAMNEFLIENIKYPVEAKKAKEEGKVYVSFVVNTDGSLSNFKVQKGVCESLDQEALRVVKLMPKWNPGKDKTSITLPITFKL